MAIAVWSSHFCSTAYNIITLGSYRHESRRRIAAGIINLARGCVKIQVSR